MVIRTGNTSDNLIKIPTTHTTTTTTTTTTKSYQI